MLVVNKLSKCTKSNFILLYRHYSNRNILSLKERGMFQDLFPDNAANYIKDILNAEPQTVYGGFDPTADSLHVGNLLVLVNLIHWQRGGHRPIALIGGATAQIGDPSGRSTERDKLSKLLVTDNVQGLHENINTVFRNHEKYIWKDRDQLKPVRIVNNHDWYSKLSAIDLVGGIARYLRMGDLLSRTSVQTRLNSPAGMSFTEFSYQLFQAYDWLHLFQNYGCKFQIGGNDQMGNIMSGYELITKVCSQQVYGLTVPLVTTEEGDKFGKSAGNAIWLSSKKTSPFSLYQFFLRQPDSEVEKFLKLFTFDTVGSISDLMLQQQNKPELRLPQKRLAEQVTVLVHGEEGLEQARKTTEALYGNSVAALGHMHAEEIAQVFEGATVVELLPEAGQSILDLAMNAKCFSRKEDALRIISAGGFYVNQQKVKNPSEILNTSVHRLPNNVSLLRVGKKNYCVVKWLS